MFALTSNNAQAVREAFFHFLRCDGLCGKIDFNVSRL